MRGMRQLFGARVRARDGEAGRVDDLYFTDDRWVVRHLVVDVRHRGHRGHWLSAGRVLVPPAAVLGVDARRVDLGLARAEVAASPGVESDRPVARQYGGELGGYLDWPYPRPGAGLASPGDPHLRSARVVLGYVMDALDRAVGRVEDLLVDEHTWALRHVVVDVGHRRCGRRVLVPAEWVIWVGWIERAVHVGLPARTVERSPAYDPAGPLDPTDEARVYGYYGHRADLTVPVGVAEGRPV